MRILSRIVATTALCGALVLTGCANRPVSAGPPPTVAQTTATQLDNLTAATQAAQSAEIAIYSQGYIAASSHLAVQQSFLRIFQDEGALAGLLSANASAADVKSKIDAIVAEVNGGLAAGVGGVKNAESKQNLQTLVSSLGSLAQIVYSAYSASQSLAH